MSQVNCCCFIIKVLQVSKICLLLLLSSKGVPQVPKELAVFCCCVCEVVVVQMFGVPQVPRFVVLLLLGAGRVFIGIVQYGVNSIEYLYCFFV